MAPARAIWSSARKLVETVCGAGRPKAADRRPNACAESRGGWSRNEEQRLHDKQGEPPRTDQEFMPTGRRTGREGVRASVVAGKRVTTVEPKDVGRRKVEMRNHRTVKAARQARRQWRGPPCLNQPKTSATVGGGWNTVSGRTQCEHGSKKTSRESSGSVNGTTLGSLNRGCSVWNTAPVSTASLTVRPHLPESRMRETRTSG